MDVHHRISYGWHASHSIVIAGAIILGVWQMGKKPSLEEVPRVYHGSAADLARIPWGPNFYVVFAAPGSGEFPYEIVDAIQRGAGVAKIENALEGHEGVWVSPKTPEAQAVADALAKMLGEPVQTYDDHGRNEIGVGFPQHRSAR